MDLFSYCVGWNEIALSHETVTKTNDGLIVSAPLPISFCSSFLLPPLLVFTKKRQLEGNCFILLLIGLSSCSSSVCEYNPMDDAILTNKARLD